MESATLFLAFFIFCLVLLYIRSKNDRILPGPVGLPLVGYLPFMSLKPYLDLQRLSKKYGSIFSIPLGSYDIVVLNDFQSTKEAFSQDAFMGRPPESPFVLQKETLDTEAINGLPWKEQRRFSLQILKDLGFARSKMEDLLKEEISDMLEHLDKTNGHPTFVKKLLSPSMSNNIAVLIFGKRRKYDDPVRIMLDHLLSESAKESALLSWQFFFPGIRKIIDFFGIGPKGRLAKINRQFQDIVRDEIEEHERTLDKNNIRDFIDGYLVEIEKRNEPAFCKNVLVDMVGMFFGAGSETVRQSLDWLTLIMGSYIDVQKRIQSEIDQVVGRARLPTWTDHSKMPYTQATIMEFMRWRTVVPINILRYTLTSWRLGEHYIPKGSIVLSNLWAIHHNPQYWGNDVEIFRPERFLSDDESTVIKSEYLIPFSIGKRSCPGESFARIEVFLYFVSLLQRFDVSLPEGRVPDFDGELGITLAPKPQELCFNQRS